MKKHITSNKIFAASILILSMLFSLVPSNFILAAEEAEDVPWQPLPCYKEDNGFYPITNAEYKGIASGENKGTDDVMYRVLANDNVQIIIKDTAEIALKTKSDEIILWKGALVSGNEKLSFYSILELRNDDHRLYLEQGAISASKYLINADCGTKSYEVKYASGDGILTIAKVKDGLFKATTDYSNPCKSTVTNITNTPPTVCSDTESGGDGSFCLPREEYEGEGLYFGVWKKDHDISSHIFKCENTFKYDIDNLKNIYPDLKKYSGTSLDTISKEMQQIYNASQTIMELDRTYTNFKKAEAIKAVLEDTDKKAEEILTLPKLSDSEKEEIIKKLNDGAKNAIDDIVATDITDSDIDNAITKNQNKLKDIAADASKANDGAADNTKVKINGTSKQAGTYIANLPNITYDEKVTANKTLDKVVTDAADKLKNAKDRAEIDKIEEDANKQIEAIKADYKKISDERTSVDSFVKDYLADERGKIVTTVTEKNIIKILQSEELWNTFNQNVKDMINAKIKEAGGSSYEAMLKEAQAASKVVSDVGDNYDTGSIPLYVSKKTSASTTLKWKKVNGVDGYFVYTNFCNTNEKKNKPKLVKDITSGNTTSCKITKRKKNKWYKYRVVAYKIINNVKTPTSQSMLIHECNAAKDYKFSGPSKVKVNKKKISLAVNKTAKIKATLVIPKGKKFKKHCDKFRYIVSDKNVAVINKKGKITAKSAGTCTIYVCAQNGIYKTVTVTVK